MLPGWPPGAPGPTLTLCIFLSVGAILTVLPEPPRDEELLVECPPTLGSVGSGWGSHPAEGNSLRSPHRLPRCTDTNTYVSWGTEEKFASPWRCFPQSHESPESFTLGTLLIDICLFQGPHIPLHRSQKAWVQVPLPPWINGMPSLVTCYLLNSVFSSIE